ncbi:hypothetical protein WJX84_002263 [Apatococcus fuscideae]|uniref:Cyclin-like domain-containing protein n=1 Tax=Apatococcus fuscideae TaxID=2026836 RepID=A0AAW1T8H4_9CHLO
MDTVSTCQQWAVSPLPSSAVSVSVSQRPATHLRASKRQKKEISRSGKPVGWKLLPKDSSSPAGLDATTPDTQSKQELLPPRLDLVGAGESEDAVNEQLPEIPLESIINSCLTTSSLIAAVGILIRAKAGSAGPAALHTDPEAVASLLQFPNFQLWHVGAVGLSAAAVTGARLVLLRNWSEFAAASDRSNRQVLQQLEPGEVALVACLPAVAEELLFRGALIPASFPDWRGVAAAGLAFGVLHNSGGRNWSFAAWASAVGVLPQAQHADENAAENREGKHGQASRGLQAQGNQRRALGDIGNVVSSYNTRRAAAQKDAAVKRAANQREGPAGGKLSVGPVTRRAAAAAANQELRATKTGALDEERNLSVSALLQKRSDAASPVSPLPDIDSKDLDDPLTCADYVGDIFSYYRSVEPKYCVDADYMAKKQTDINAKMRAILIDWLVEVHQKFKLLPDTLFLTINIIDRFLQKKPVTRKNLQLVGVTAMLLAAKYEEIWPPEVRDFVYISDQAYTREQILDMEKLMLNTLRFNMTVPTPLKFLARYFKAANLSQTSLGENTSRQCDLDEFHLAEQAEPPIDLQLASFAMLQL